MTPESLGRVKAYCIDIATGQITARALKNGLQRTFVAKVMNSKDSKEGNLSTLRIASSRGILRDGRDLFLDQLWTHSLANLTLRALVTLPATKNAL